jgi:hypothetical protein
MAINLLKDKGRPLSQQKFTWKEMVRPPISKLNADAFTRVRIILMNGIESDTLRFLHVLNRICPDLRRPLADVRRIDQHQQTTINWLLPRDQSVLETTIGYEQVAIEVTASVAQNEPDPYLAQAYRYGMLEDFDHMYRYSALMDRLEGRDSNNILQGYTDVAPGRATWEEHRAPQDDLCDHYDRGRAAFVSKLNALTIVSGEFQTHDYYMTVGPLYADPVARQLYAEIASVEEQHVTQYESLLDPNETLLEKWLLHEANEVHNYYSCVESESDSRVKAIWERFLDYELGHLQAVMDLFKRYERRDPAELIPESLPAPIAYQSQRKFVREVLRGEKDLRRDGPRFVPKDQESPASLEHRAQLNSEGAVSRDVSAGFRWSAGTELARMLNETGEIDKGAA